MNEFSVWVGPDREDQLPSKYPKGHKVVKLKRNVPKGMTEFGVWVGNRYVPAPRKPDETQFNQEH